MMGDLPICRLIPNEKRWGVIFKGISSRKLAHSLTTDSVIMAINRFCARRGAVFEMFSDNGTNLKGAEQELKKAIQQLNLDQVKQQFSMKKTKWHFNPPAAPHFGGC
jgi:hypothetical protein